MIAYEYKTGVLGNPNYRKIQMVQVICHTGQVITHNEHNKRIILVCPLGNEYIGFRVGMTLNESDKYIFQMSLLQGCFVTVDGALTSDTPFCVRGQALLVCIILLERGEATDTTVGNSPLA